jgi:hypothetical protein
MKPAPKDADDAKVARRQADLTRPEEWKAREMHNAIEREHAKRKNTPGEK